VSEYEGMGAELRGNGCVSASFWVCKCEEMGVTHSSSTRKWVSVKLKCEEMGVSAVSNRPNLPEMEYSFHFLGLGMPKVLSTSK